ncbi:PepSY domain-containing protein [Rhizobium sp. CSW-27]|uniref:PepSY domain-containing protein n=1 Tax=Rhizobium sp. CSW-27 TaxID=2839985 RepID=UPI001C027BCC|nr:PepSY domain-containing protein [Rhizobium sp. CSW-27]MBT9372966.1 PepSY domain-containing protein [Rhizobium sp. CSW-27]
MKTRNYAHHPLNAGRPAQILLVVLSVLGAGSASAAPDLPESIRDLHLTDVEVRPEPHHHHGRIVEGRLPSGEWIKIDLDDRDDIQEIETDSRRGFRLSDVSPIIPRTVRESDDLPANATIEKLEFHDRDEIEIEGWDAANREFKARVSISGKIIEIKFD